jgi:hypothetical protein
MRVLDGKGNLVSYNPSSGRERPAHAVPSCEGEADFVRFLKARATELGPA